jgi:pimeloyl-ACP methyl ester carboxylesterase
MANHTDDGKPNERLVRLDDGEMHVVEDGRASASALLLIHGTAGSTAWWDPIVPVLAETYRVIRVDLLGHGRSSTPAGGFDIPTQARRVGAALDRVGVNRATVVGHSAGCTVATALAEERPRAVAALALIDMGPSPDAKFPDGLLARLLLTRLAGHDAPGSHGSDARSAGLSRRTEPSRPTRCAGHSGGRDLRRRRPAVAVHVGGRVRRRA